MSANSAPATSRTPFYRRRRLKSKTPAPALRRLSGGAVILARPQGKGWLRRGGARPVFWRSLAFALSGSAPVPERRLNLWLLVLEAKKIPHRFFPGITPPQLYVPPLCEGVALQEIQAVEAERGIPLFAPSVRNNVWGVMVFFAFLLVWHGLRQRWFVFNLSVPPFPAQPDLWPPLFGLDVYKARALGEWWRTATALTLHSGEAHLFSNLGFGLIFFVPLCRRAGLGLGIALAVLGGIFGNAANALIKEAHVLSIGFSTALFAGLGALCALNGSDVVRHHLRHARSAGMALAVALGRGVLLPLAAGLALLGLFGGGGEAGTDYAAHICGFFMGALVSFAALPLERRIFSLSSRSQSVAQAGLFTAVFALFAGFWAYALA